MFSTAEQIKELFRSFDDLKVMIIGDVMIDSYLKGHVDRISPEAPVPVVALNQREDLLGGAANVALNIKSLGAKPILCSIIGDDEAGAVMLQLLEKENISTAGIYKQQRRITTTKYRIIGNNVQMLRVDHETDAELSRDDEKRLLAGISGLISSDKPDAIILQDYNKGILTKRVIENIIQMAAQAKIPVVVDPKKKNFSAYRSIALFKPNLKEVREGLKIDIDPRSERSLREAAELIHSRQDTDTVMITMSEHGIFISRRNGEAYDIALTKAHLRSIADVSGAGDTVISIASLCIAVKLPVDVLAELANLAGGLVCEHVGVVPVNKQALIEETISLYFARKS